jgi:predicted dehydrogenase
MSTIGIIGAGQLTQQYYLPALRNMRLFNKILVADTTNERLKECEARFECTGVLVDELQEQCSHIVIATPPSTHAELIKSCIGRAKHILCEKPVLLDTASFNILLADSVAQACHIYGAHIRRLFPAVAAARSYVQQTHTGKLLKAEIFEGGRYTYQSRSAYHMHSTTGGVWADTGAHALDAVFYICGLSDNGTNPVFTYIKRDKSEPAHAIQTRFTWQEAEYSVVLSRYQQLSNKINLYFEYCTIEVPLYLHPYFTVWKEQRKEIHSCEFLPAYLPQAFRMELNEVFMKHNRSLFGLEQFKLITRVLEAGLNQS